MPVPTNLSDLSQTPASNSPASTDTLSTADDYLRAQASILAKISAGTNALVSPSITTLSVTGNTTLGDASTDTVQVNGYMGVGGAANAAMGVRVIPNALTGAAQYGIVGDPTGTNAASTLIAGVWGRAQTAAAAYTTSDLVQLYAAGSVKGAGSTITNQHGVYIVDQTQGTNNYGITSLVSSGTNKWNIYASGTAANYFAGNVGIGTNAPLAGLDVRALPTVTGAARYTLIADENQAAAVGRGGGIAFSQQGTVLGGIGMKTDAAALTAAAMTFATVGGGTVSERLRIDSSGGVGVVQSGKIGARRADGALVSHLSNVSDTETRITADGGGAFFTIHTNNGTVGERFRIDNAGNLGLGVTPSAWQSGTVALEGTDGGIWYRGAGSGIDIVTNAFFNGAVWTYKQNAPVTRFTNNNGSFNFYSKAAGTGTFATGALTQVLGVDLGKSLALQGATSQTGAGISFPATQVASSDANTLDDYREGTLTTELTVVGSSTAGTCNYTTRKARYIKVGKKVTVWGSVAYDTHTGTGNIRISGLPFTAVTDGSVEYIGTCEVVNMTLPANSLPVAYVTTAGTQILMGSITAGTGTISALAMDAAASIYFSVTYEAAA